MNVPPIPDFVVLPDVALERAPVLLERLAPQAPIPELLAAPTPQFAPEASEPAHAAGLSLSHAAVGAADSAPAQASNGGGNPSPSAGGDTPAPAKAAASDTQQDDKPEVGAQQASKSTPAETDALVTQWFNRGTQNDDLTLLDDILRGDTGVSTQSPSDIAAEWERSHQWLSRYVNLRNGAGDANADGADLSGLSYLGLDDNGFEMPRAVVGLRGVAGHELKAFKGLQEGVKVLGVV